MFADDEISIWRCSASSGGTPPDFDSFFDVFSRFLSTDKTKPEFGDLPLTSFGGTPPLLSKNNEFSFSH